MYEKIHDLVVDIDLRESEEYYKRLQTFIRKIEDMETYADISKLLEKMLKETKDMEQLKDIEDFLWKKIYKKVGE